MDPSNHDHAETNAVTVKLPEFWQHNPRSWFYQVEAMFHLRRITADETKYFHVVAALDSTAVLKLTYVLDNPPLDNKFQTLKTAILRAFQPSDATRAEQLFALMNAGLGDADPTSHMARMLALRGTTDLEFLFAQMFLRVLPPAASAALVNSPCLQSRDYQQLAVEAERILATTKTARVSAIQPPQAAAASPDTDSEPAAVAAVGRKKKKKRGPLCYYHRKFGAKAVRCVPPCTASPSGNDRAGAL